MSSKVHFSQYIWVNSNPPLFSFHHRTFHVSFQRPTQCIIEEIGVCVGERGGGDADYLF